MSNNLNKRIFTSLILIFLFVCSIYNIYLMFIFSLIFFYQLFYEFYFIFNKIFIKNKKLKYLLSLVILFYLTIFFIQINQIFLNHYKDQKIFLLFIINVCIFTDIGGYVFGKIFKGKKLTNISPNKTYSGAIGSYLLSIIISLISFESIYNINEIFILTIIISTISQVGDLFISFLKRKAKIKDTGNFLPGHGGMLDRFDGMIFAIPIGFIIYIL